MFIVLIKDYSKLNIKTNDSFAHRFAYFTILGIISIKGLRG